MASELVERALRTADQTEEIAMGKDVLDQVGPVFARVFPGKDVLLVADENTFAAAGAPAFASLEEAGIRVAASLIFPGEPTLYAGYENVEKVREFARPYSDAIICSIAAGSLNDIAKLASAELGRRYMNVCTAASVDGYASFGASISKDGFKNTRDCPAPAALVVDSEVMVNAPERLTATGYGDLIEKIPAGADWILADELGIEPIDDYVWDLVQGSLEKAIGDPQKVAEKEFDAIEALAEGNVMSGLAMQAHQSSRPASGAGHQFSHTWEMEGHGLDWEPPLSHGFKVGVGTVASLAIWEEVVKIDFEAIDIEAIVAAAPSDDDVVERIHEYLIPRIHNEAIKHSLAKNLQGDALRERLEQIKIAWPQILERVKKQLVSPGEVAGRLKIVGAPYHPAMIGIDWDRFRKTHKQAQMIRLRYTVLDLLADTGLLDHVIDALFAPEGYWGKIGPELPTE